MTSKRLLSIVYELSQIIPRRNIKIKEIFKMVGLKENLCNEVEIDLLLYNLGDKGYVSLTHSAKTGIIGVSLTELGQGEAEGG